MTLQKRVYIPHAKNFSLKIKKSLYLKAIVTFNSASKPSQFDCDSSYNYVIL